MEKIHIENRGSFEMDPEIYKQAVYEVNDLKLDEVNKYITTKMSTETFEKVKKSKEGIFFLMKFIPSYEKILEELAKEFNEELVKEANKYKN
jgi:hypothetical protein